MTNSLSEQVAGLERQITKAWDIAEAWKLNSERHWKRVEELEAECDQLKADAISDLIKRHWLENQVKNREVELEELRSTIASHKYNGEARDRVVTDLRAERDDLQRQVQEARDENERLRDLVDVLGKHVTIPSEHIRFKGMTDIRYKEPEDDFPCCSSKSTGYADDDHQDAEITDWHESEPETVAAEDGIKGIFTTLLKAKKTEDERAQQVWDAWRTAFAEVYLGQDDDDHQDAEAIETVRHGRQGRIIPAPRLTAHDLEVAPAGSLLRHVNGAVIEKLTDGLWDIHPDYSVTSEYLISGGWADATLTYPEDQ